MNVAGHGVSIGKESFAREFNLSTLVPPFHSLHSAVAPPTLRPLSGRFLSGWRQMEESSEFLMNEIRGRLDLLESNLPHRVDAAAVSLTAKIPFKAMLGREALIWRMAELSRNAFV